MAVTSVHTHIAANARVSFGATGQTRHSARRLCRSFGPLVCAFTLVAGCGSRTPAIVVYGGVTCGGQDVPSGQVSLVPIENTPGGVCAARIIDGLYRIEDRGGVPLGKYRVCVDARRKTGRKVRSTNGTEITMVDEIVRMGPAAFSGVQSPLTVEIAADFDGKFDISIPK